MIDFTWKPSVCSPVSSPLKAKIRVRIPVSLPVLPDVFIHLWSSSVEDGIIFQPCEFFSVWCWLQFAGCGLLGSGQDCLPTYPRRREIFLGNRDVGDPLSIPILPCFETLSDRNHGWRRRAV